MVVKVISEGPSKTYEIECPHCDYMLQYVKEDVKVYHGSIGDYSDYTSYSIKCPRHTCGKSVDVKKP